MSGSTIAPYYRGHSPPTPLEALILSNLWLGLVLVLVSHWVYFLVYPRFSAAARHTRHLQRRLARLPLPLEGLHAAWLAPGGPGPARSTSSCRLTFTQSMIAWLRCS